MSVSVTQIEQLVNEVVWPLVVDGAGQRRASVIEQICDVQEVDSSTLYGERGDSMLGMDRPRKRRDGEVIQSSDTSDGYSWQFPVDLYARSIEIPERLLEASDAAGRIKGLLATLVPSFFETFELEIEDQIARKFQRGTLTAGDLTAFTHDFPNNPAPSGTNGYIYDGVPWFDGAHPRKDGSATTYSNIDVANALTQANLQSALTKMKVTNAVDERGNRLVVMPDTLLVPAGAMGFQARVITGTQQVVGSANNDINPVAGSLNVVEWAALTDDTDAWWLGCRGKGIRVRRTRQPDVRQWFDETRRVHVVSLESKYGSGVTNWRYWYCANKADS